MKHVLVIVLSIGAVTLPAFAEDTVPYAYRQPMAGETYVPGLGNIIEAIQWRHIKLSYAGKSANWELARYELGQMQESLSDAARLYQGIPIEQVNMIEQPVMALSEAIKSKAGSRFMRAFADLTGACNSCHAAAQVGFITIQVPTASPFTDQSFAPKGK
jgi:hypothetical protein